MGDLHRDAPQTPLPPPVMVEYRFERGLEETFRPPLNIAIIGAGITGLTLALGLHARGIRFTIYERNPALLEVGAGIGFSPNAERAMHRLAPIVWSTYKQVANPNGEDLFQWVDGVETNEVILRIPLGKDGFQGCRRQDIVEAWAGLLPPGSIVFGKEFSNYTQYQRDVELEFSDGTAATADAIIGCDGIWSRLRSLLHRPPAKYTRKFCYRALVTMPKAIAAIGHERALTRFMYIGPGAHVLSYPVSGNNVLNILVVLSDPEPDWVDPLTHIIPGDRSEIEQALEGWHPAVLKLVRLMPQKMRKWAIFEMKPDPESYAHGMVCMAGDAAHAMGPHLGAGAGMGIEDALMLAENLGMLQEKIGESCESREKARCVAVALQNYAERRRDRTRETVKATREVCELFHQSKEWRKDILDFQIQVASRFFKVWNYDTDEMIEIAMFHLTEDIRHMEFVPGYSPTPSPPRA